MRYQCKRDKKGHFIPVITNRNKICKFCGKTFTPSIRNFARNKFCSASCASKSRPSGRKGKKGGQYQKDMVKLKLSGVNHWRWIKDRTTILERQRIRASIEWRIWRGKVFERDDYACQECKRKKIPLEPHHIIPQREDKQKIFDINNGITLCRDCHHKTIWKEKDFVEKYLNIIKLNTSVSKVQGK